MGMTVTIADIDGHECPAIDVYIYGDVMHVKRLDIVTGSDGTKPGIYSIIIAYGFYYIC